MSVADRLDAARHSLGGSNVAVAVCKASSREVMGPKKKHVDFLISCTQHELTNLANMIELLFERCRMSSWVIVSKALVTFHNLMSAAHERFLQNVASRTVLWNLENFSDKAAVVGYDMSAFIRRYSNYLTQKAKSYAAMEYDFCRVNRGPDGVMKSLDTPKLLRALAEVQTQLDILLEVDLQSSEFSNGVINSAFVLLFKDMRKLFACYNDGMIVLIEKYYTMNKDDCKESLDIYKKFITRIESVKKFLKVAQDVGVNQNAIQDFVEAPNNLLEALENHYRSLEKGNIPKESTAHPNLAPITVPLVSQQININGEATETQESPQEDKENAAEPTLLQTAQTSQSTSQEPWETLFEPQETSPKASTASTNQNDLLELHAVFQSHQASTAGFPANADFGSAGFGTGNIQPVTGGFGSLQTVNINNPFETHADIQPELGGNLLQPVNQAPSQPDEAPNTSTTTTGDLHSSLSKVAKSLDNLELGSPTATLGSSGGGHQWAPAKPKLKTGGAAFQMTATSATTVPPTSPVSPVLPSSPSGNSVSPTSPLGSLVGPKPGLRPGYIQPSPFGQQVMRPQTNTFPHQNVRPTNPFVNPVPRNQALF